MNLLCGTDFSPNAMEAVTTAATLARQFHDTLTLVHAHETPVDDGNSPPLDPPTDEVIARQLEAIATPLRSPELTLQTRLERGTPVEVLGRLATPGQTRLIVLSSIGRVALARVLLGSVADRVAETAPVPTLVVRRGMVFTDWLQGRRPLRIFVAADFSVTSDAALSFVQDWAAAGSVEIVVGHAVDLERAEAPGSAESFLTVVEQELQDRAKTALRNLPFQSEVIIVPTPTLSAGLIELAKEHRADLVITGTHQRHGVKRLWHHSMSRALLADAPMNVVVVPVPVVPPAPEG